MNYSCIHIYWGRNISWIQTVCFLHTRPVVYHSATLFPDSIFVGHLWLVNIWKLPWYKQYKALLSTWVNPCQLESIHVNLNQSMSTWVNVIFLPWYDIRPFCPDTAYILLSWYDIRPFCPDTAYILLPWYDIRPFFLDTTYILFALVWHKALFPWHNIHPFCPGVT